MAGKMYGKALLSLFNKEINWTADTIKCALFTSSHTPNQDTDQYYGTLTNEVANGNGYTTGGVTLTNCAMSYNADANTVTLTADNPSWPDSTFSNRYAVIYDATPANKPLVCYQDWAVDKSPSAGTFSITWPATGIVQATVA